MEGVSDSGEGQAFSAQEDAFARTTSLPRATRRGEIICPLGTDDIDWFIYDLLCNAGITLELIEVDKQTQQIKVCGAWFSLLW